uniref:Uncharacterized protein n=1 Tax=Anguilla anguilla TaxID=7936 RepID=A0A0E9VD18_ANGAN
MNCSDTRNLCTPTEASSDRETFSPIFSQCTPQAKAWWAGFFATVAYLKEELGR